MLVDETSTAADRPARRAAVLGSPIRHSLSPVLHGAAYQALGLHGWRYDMIEYDEPGLAPLLDGMGPEWAGLSLTMPLKRVALAVADEVSPLARAVGAANTLVFPPGGPAAGRRADNTDVAGLVAALREAGLGRIQRAVILGAGGTAQSALAAVRELGHQAPVVLVRNLARTAELRETAERLGMRPAISGRLFEEPLPEADLVISTLPRGAADPLRPARWKPGTTVLDVVYAPWPTPFAGSALAAGCQVVSGLTVLLHQAVAQVELMTGYPGPVEAMRTALAAAVAARHR
ncbi:MAG TPA: shikimate dehydrogenase [Actinobacteria bacterium]|nr:shikimate dehydrogenase [Actinomycetota bacterium]